ncbi:MAG: class IV adenylate cyclase [Clostridium sp.]
MHEIETRIIHINVDDIRNKLNKINAVKVKEENQINNIYDFNDKRMLNSKGYARIREVNDLLNNQNIYYMTTKKLVSQEKYKIMDEYEVIIDNPKQGKKIFQSLGLELVESIKKYRESYKYKNTLVEIDINDPTFCPFPYIEIESCNEDEIIEVVELLGYSMSDTTSKTIYEILENTEGLKGL